MKACKLTSKYQTTVPEEVRAALNLKKGDSVLFIVDGKDVRLKKATKSDLVYLESIQSQLTEWNSEDDDKAFSDL